MKMFRTLSRSIQPYANTRYILPVLGVFVMVLVVLELSPIGAVRLAAISGGQGMLDMQFGYSAGQAYAMFAEIGETGRQLYVRLLGLDGLFTVVYMVLQALLITALMRKTRVPEQWITLNLLPLVRCVLDIVENILLCYVLIRYPAQYHGLVAACSWVTSIKLALHYGYIGIMFLLGALSTRELFVGILRKTTTNKAEERL